MAIAGYRLGIDFGTSNTVAVLAHPDGRVEPLLFDGAELLPSAVCATPSGLLIGRDALHAARANPASFEPTPKRCIDSDPLLLGDIEIPLVTIIATLLERIALEARRVAGCEPSQVVITCPAGWGIRRQQVLTAAAAAAGFGQVTLVPEPVAAGYYFATVALAQIPPGGYVVIYDLGAGTFDATVLNRGPAGFQVASEQGLPDAGGLDTDAAIMSFLGASHAQRDPESWQRLSRPSTAEDRRASRNLWDDVRVAKEMLSRAASASIYIPFFDDETLLTRDQLEQLARPILERTIRATQAAIRDAGITPEQVSALFLVGGASRTPLVATLLHQHLGLAPTVLERPELVVANGSLLTPINQIEAPQPQPQPQPQSQSQSQYQSQGQLPAPISVPPPPPPSLPPSPFLPLPLSVPPAPQIQNMLAPAAPTAWNGQRRRSRLVVAAVVLTVLLVTMAVAVAKLMGDRSSGNAGKAGPASASSGVPTSSAAAKSETPFVSASATVKMKALTGHTSAVYAVAISPDGKTLASGGKDQTIRIWDLATEQTTQTLTGHTSWVRAVTFSPDGKLLASAGGDGTVRLWDLSAGKTVQVLTGNSAWIDDIAFSPDGRTLAAANGDSTISLWEVATGRSITVLTGHTKSVTGVSFSPDGKTLATCSYDQTIRVWSLDTYQPLLRLEGHTDIVEDVSFSPDGRTLASVSKDATARLWDVASGSTTQVLTGHTTWVRTLAFSPSGGTMATAGYDQTIRLWRVATGENLNILTGTSGGVEDLAFSPDGRTLASGGYDQTVRLWTYQFSSK